MTEEKQYEFCLIGLPRSDNGDQFEKIKKLTQKFSANFKFDVPQLRVGTLDQLVTASSQLKTLDASLTDSLSRMIGAMRDLLEMKDEEIVSHLMISERSMPVYLHKFRWNVDKYPTHLTIDTLQQIIIKDIAFSEQHAKKLIDEYMNVKDNAQTLEKSFKGSLMTRNICELVKKEDFVQNSQYLVTAVVVVHKSDFMNWQSCYELLDEEVVPRSSKLLYSDDNYGLFNVTLFKRHLAQFTKKARENKFYVRDFTYNDSKHKEEVRNLKTLKHEMYTSHKPLLRTIKACFSDLYAALVHVYSMRLFVDSILYFGLPAKYLYLFVIVPTNNMKKYKSIMLKEYSYLDLIQVQKEESREEKRAIGNEDFTPYVFIQIRADIKHF